jgi:hypothetical protein
MSKLDETGELTDATTRDLIKQQLASFARYIGRVGAKTS